MILPIYTFGQPVLRKVAQDIPVDYPDLQQLIKDMFETLDASSGVGLAAPQIGKSIRVVVIDLDVLKEEFPQYAGFRHAFINGHILEADDKAGKETLEEGCLSFLDSVRMSRALSVSTLPGSMRTSNRTTSGWTAIVPE